MAKTDGASRITLRFAKHLPHECLLLREPELRQNLLGTVFYFLCRCGNGIDQEAAQQPLLHVRMEMRLQFRPCVVMAANQESVEVVAVHQGLHQPRRSPDWLP